MGDGDVTGAAARVGRGGWLRAGLLRAARAPGPVVLVVTLAVFGVALWALWPGDAADDADDLRPFDQAIANLADHPAVRFRNDLGGATMELEVTATGHALGRADLGIMTSEMLQLGGRLFIRLPEGTLPTLPDLGGAGVQLPDYTGRWLTMNEEVGAAMRDSMAPPRLAVALSGMLAAGREAGLSTAEGRIAGTRVLVAELPTGNLSITASRPHQVMRFEPNVPDGGIDVPGTIPEGADDPEAPPPPPPIPELPSIPEGGSPTIPEGELPTIPEVPEGELPTIPTIPDRPQLPPVPPPPDPPPVPLQRFVQSATLQPQPPEGGVGSAISGVVTGGRVDVSPVPAGEVGRVYADLQEAAAELGDAVNTDVVLTPGDPVTGPCDASSCRAEVDVEIEHANGTDVPARVDVAITVGGLPAGGCSATGALPASGTGRVGCTNDSAEWRAAQQAVGGGDVAASASVVAQAMTAQDVDVVTHELTQQAESAAGRLVESCTTPTEATDTGVERTLRSLRIQNGARRLGELCGRIGRQGRDQPAADVLNEADVRDAQTTIARLPLDRLDRQSTARVVGEVLRARGRRQLARWLNILRSGTEAATDAAEGTVVHLDVGGNRNWRNRPQLPFGDESYSFRTLDLGPSQRSVERRRIRGALRLDVVFLRRDGTLEARQVLGNAREIEDRQRRQDVFRAAVGFPNSGPNYVFNLDVLANDGLGVLHQPFDDLAPSAPPVADIEALLPAQLLDDAELQEALANPSRDRTFFVFVVLVGDRVELPEGNQVHWSGGGYDAEVASIRAGDPERARQHAATRGTPDQPAQVAGIGLRAPCQGLRPSSGPQSCTTELVNAREDSLSQVGSAEREANIASRDLLVPLYPYEPTRPERRGTETTTEGIETLSGAGYDLAVGRVDGALAPSALRFLETLMTTEATRASGSTATAAPPTTASPGRPQSATTPRSSTMPAGRAPAPTMFNLLHQTGGQVRAGSYQLDTPKTSAVATSVQTTGIAPERLQTVEAMARELYEPLHQRGVCI